MGPRSILITGANRGLGLEFVQQILSQSSPPKFLLATCRDPTKADELQTLAKKHDNLKILKMNVSVDSEIEAAFQEAKEILADKGLNLLINNAAINDKSNSGSLQTLTRETLQSHFNTNSTAPVMIVKQFLPLLQQAADNKSCDPMGPSWAAVINISSGMGSISSTLKASQFNAYHYRSSKAALNMLTALMSNELREKGIMVTALHPGWVQTDMGGASADLDKNTSIQAMWATISSMTDKSSGLMLKYDGSVIPW